MTWPAPDGTSNTRPDVVGGAVVGVVLGGGDTGLGLGADVVGVVLGGGGTGLGVATGEVTPKVIVGAVAEPWLPEAAMLAPIVHDPGPTKATAPVDGSIVQTVVVVERYVLAPVPAEAVDVMVGGVAVVA